MAEKRLYDDSEVDYLLDEWRDGNGESDNFNRIAILNKINSIVRRNLEEFADEIDYEIEKMEPSETFEHLIKSALARRGIEL